MKTITTNTKNILLVTTLALFLSACGGNSDDNNSNADAETTATTNKIIEACQNNSKDAILAKATVIPASSTVKKSTVNTILRVWHFQNSAEAVCVVQGSAEIVSTI